MLSIENYNADKTCIEKACNRTYTHYTPRTINGLELLLPFCEKHARKYETYNRRTERLGAVKKTGETPKVGVIVRGIYAIIEECPFCCETHLHGTGGQDVEIGDSLGHRVAHCQPESTPPTGYELIVKAIGGQGT